MCERMAANLQVKGARRAEVAALLPEATVGRWADDFITVLDENFNIKSVSIAAKDLSGRLPYAVLAAALEDDSRLELSVWKNGKCLSARVFNAAGGESRKGDPRAFCQALDLLEEDIPRLETIWDRGNAREQLKNTGILMGAPLDCSAQRHPWIKIYRDTDWVDEWIGYLAECKKEKNQTRTQILQKLSGLTLSSLTEGNGWEGFFHLSPVEEPGDCDWEENLFWRAGPAGKLEYLPQLDPRPNVIRPCQAACTYIPIGRGRILSLLRDDEPGCSVVVEDSAGLLVCPLVFRMDGNRRSCQNAWAMEDGGILALLESLEEESSNGLVRYAADGAVLWSRELDHTCEIQLFADNRLWLSDEEGFFSIGIQGEEGARIALSPECRRDEESGHLACYTMLKASSCGQLWLIKDTYGGNLPGKNSMIISFDCQGEQYFERLLPPGVLSGLCNALAMRDKLLLYQYDQGIWLLSLLGLKILAGSTDHKEYMDAEQDGMGRIWLFMVDEAEAYDENLALISHHHLKGEICHHYLDKRGHMCVITFEEEEHIIRVYRLA